MKQKLKALASLCLALALTLCLTLPAWAAGGDGAAGRSITEQTTGSIEVSGVESGVTVNVYRLMDVNVDDTVNQPQMPVYSWVNEVASWVRTNNNTYIGTGTDNSVQEAFSKAGTDDIAAFYDSLAAAIRGDTIKGLTTPTETGKAIGEGENASCTISDLPMGNYLVLIEGGMKIYRPSAVNLVPEWKPGEGDTGEWVLKDASVKLKSSSLGITKTVVDGIYTQVTNVDQPNGKKYAQVAIGDTVTYILEADVPQYPASATATGYYISDKLPNGMTVDQIQVFGVDANTNETSLLRSSDDASKEEDSENKKNFHYYSTLTGEPQRPTGKENEKTVDFVLSFVYDKIKDYSKIRVVYTAKVNENIQVVDDKGNTTGNQNTAYLDYNNNPYEAADPTWKTASDTAIVYTYGIKVTKTDDKDGNKLLAGAEFQVYKDEDGTGEIAEGAKPLNFVAVGNNGGAYRVAVSSENNKTDKVTTIGGTSATDPNLTLSGLDVGTYILKETKAPDEYNLPSHTFSVTITDDQTISVGNGGITTTPNGKPEYDKPNANGEGTTKTDRADGYQRTTITNTQGFTLPTTGGMGTVLFTAGGVVLMGAGLVLLVVFLRRRAK